MALDDFCRTLSLINLATVASKKSMQKDVETIQAKEFFFDGSEDKSMSYFLKAK